MGVDDLRRLFEYNYWAKDRILGVVEGLSPEDFTKNLGSSHGGVRDTLVHIMGAEELWYKRWRGEPVTSMRRPEETPTFDSLQNRWNMIAMEVLGFCHMLKSDEDAARVITYKDLKGNEFRQVLSGLMQHLVNHSSYHRGQVVTMLRQLGVKPVATDLIVFLRERQA